MSRRGTKQLVLAGLALLWLAALAPMARADDSQIRISEVYSDGTLAHGDFVEVQLLADGQQVPQDSAIRICNAIGSVCANYTTPPNTLPAALSQRTVLFGWNDNPNADFGIPMGFNFPIAGGSACYVSPASGPVDCVAWGGYTAGALAAVGTPASPMDGTASLTRTEARGCPSQMEAVDDTDNSASDFALAGPSPRNNFAPPSEVKCPVAPPPVAKKKCKKKEGHRSAAAAKKKKCKKKRKK